MIQCPEFGNYAARDVAAANCILIAIFLAKNFSAPWQTPAW